MEKAILKFVAKIALKTANVAYGSASVYGFYQLKEPKNIQSKLELIKKGK